jgi:hypothetical protein
VKPLVVTAVFVTNTPFAIALADEDCMPEALPFRVNNAKQVRAYFRNSVQSVTPKISYSSAKTDKLDAKVLAQFAADMKLSAQPYLSNRAECGNPFWANGTSKSFLFGEGNWSKSGQCIPINWAGLNFLGNVSNCY